MLGRAFKDANKADAQTLLTAASALNLGGHDVNNITQQVQQNFGLDELSIESTPMPATLANTNNLQQNTSLVVGKALSSRLYINYSVGLLAPINILKIRYLLGKNWAIQSQSSTLGNGVDVYYTIER